MSTIFVFLCPAWHWRGTFSINHENMICVRCKLKVKSVPFQWRSRCSTHRALNKAKFYYTKTFQFWKIFICAGFATLYKEVQGVRSTADSIQRKLRGNASFGAHSRRWQSRFTSVYHRRCAGLHDACNATYCRYRHRASSPLGCITFMCTQPHTKYIEHNKFSKQLLFNIANCERNEFNSISKFDSSDGKRVNRHYTSNMSDDILLDTPNTANKFVN